MNILTIDTSGPYAGAAVTRDGDVVAEITACHGLTHSQTSMPMAAAALDASGLMPSDIDLFAAVAGPGSFTGVRIGVCEIKGLAHAVGKKCVAVDALEALAVNGFGFPGLICPILDARRGQVYCASFRFASGTRPVRLLNDAALALEEFLERLPRDEDCLFLGDGLSAHFRRVSQVLGDRASAAPAHMSYLRTSAACALAALDRERAVEPMALEPIYLRAPQAERERRAKAARA